MFEDDRNLHQKDPKKKKKHKHSFVGLQISFPNTNEKFLMPIILLLQSLNFTPFTSLLRGWDKYGNDFTEDTSLGP